MKARMKERKFLLMTVTLIRPNSVCTNDYRIEIRPYRNANGVQTVGRKTSWAKDVWANYFLGDRRLGDNSHFRKDFSPKDGWATKA